jgi:16S rRNA (uracil1498-N3)-methyltransferase
VRRRFFVEKFEGQRALVSGDRARHLGVVLRAQAGQLYELSDGERVCLGRIEKVARDMVEFALLEELPANEPTFHVTLLLSVLKFDAFEWAIEKATELGVTEIVPLAAARSEKALIAAAEKRSERWRKIVLEAAQQSRRVRLPVLQPVARPEAAFAARGDQLGIFLSERADAPPLRIALRSQAASEAVLAVESRLSRGFAWEADFAGGDGGGCRIGGANVCAWGLVDATNPAKTHVSQALLRASELMLTEGNGNVSRRNLT